MDTVTIDISKYKNIIKIGIYMELINHEYDIEKMAKEYPHLKIKQQTSRKLRTGPLQKTIPLRLNIPNGCELESLTLFCCIFTDKVRICYI